MSRKLDQPWIRVDAQFIDDDTYIALPAAVRNDAYLFLVALAGRSKVNQSDGHLRLSTVAEIARRMRVKATPILDALVAESMVVVTNDEVILQKQDKWQVLKAEVDELRDERAAAGAKGGQQKAGNRVAKGEQTPSKPVANGIANPAREEKNREEKNREREENNTGAALAAMTPAGKLVNVLAEAIAGNGSKPPNTHGWELEADRMLRLDRRDPDEAEGLIRWCQDSSFWKSNVLSMGKFREKYDTLRLQRARPSSQPTSRMGRAIKAGREWQAIADDLEAAGVEQ